MKRFILILVVLQTLSVLVFRTSLISEVLKVNEFIEHFSEHRQEKNGFGFFEFIKLHYIDQQVYDEDYAQDMRLPFKTAHVQFLGAIDVTEKSEIGLPKYQCDVCNKVTQKIDFILPQSFIGGIWQPPRA